MRRWASAALVGALATAAPALADPADVYVDYAADGQLSCAHPRADLEGILTDASLNEYGDPLTLTRLKIVVRRQLRVGCQTASAPAPPPQEPAPASEPPADTPATTPAPPKPKPGEHAGDQQRSEAPQPSSARGEPLPVETAPPTTAAPEPTAPDTTLVAAPAAVDDDGDDPSSGAGIALVVGGLAAGAGALAAAGWLARRTLTRDG